MLRYELMENTDAHIVYRYFPDGKDPYGTITVRKSDKAIIEHRIAETDELKWCFHKMYGYIKKFIDEGKYRNNGTIAWY